MALDGAYLFRATLGVIGVNEQNTKLTNSNFVELSIAIDVENKY